MQKNHYLFIGAVLATVVWLLAAAVPSQTDFDTAYFNTNALPITLTNRLKTIGDLADAAGYLKNDGAGGFSYDNPAGAGDVVGLNVLTNQMPLLGADSKNIFATNTAGFRAAVGLVIGTDVQAPATTFAGYNISDTSANLRTAITDESGTGAALFAGGAIGAATVTAPAADDSSTRVPSTAWVQTELADYAPLASPALTGDPTAPTASANDNDTSVATTAFVTSSTTAFTGKTFDAAATGNVLKQTRYLNFIHPAYGDGAGAIPQTNNYTASGLMHYTFSGSAETNVNWVVYEASVYPDIDTSVAMTATLAFVSGGTDADDVTFHITYALGTAGTALPSGTSIATSPIVMTVTPTTPGSGVVQTTAAVTLTGWAGSMTAGAPLFIRVARLNTANDDTARDMYLRIAYGSTQ